MPVMGNRIRQYREQRGWSREELAARIPCHANTIVKLEAEERQLTESWLRKLGPALGVPFYALLDGAPEAPANDAEMDSDLLRLAIRETRLIDGVLPEPMSDEEFALAVSEFYRQAPDYQDRQSALVAKMTGDILSMRLRQEREPQRNSPSRRRATK